MLVVQALLWIAVIFVAHGVSCPLLEDVPEDEQLGRQAMNIGLSESEFVIYSTKLWHILALQCDKRHLKDGFQKQSIIIHEQNVPS